MRQWILDFVFDEVSGQCRLLIDFNDASLTTLEINSMIQDGELREEVIGLAGEIFGEALAERLRSGELPLVCLDDEPREQPRDTLALPQQQLLPWEQEVLGEGQA